MSKMMTLPVASMPPAIQEAVTAVLARRGIRAKMDMAHEIAERVAAALADLDESLDHDAEPTLADRLTTGETLRTLGHLGRPNAEVASSLSRVGTWLVRNAKAELAKDGKAA